MDAHFTVTFKGFAQKSAAMLEKMLRQDIAGYPARVEMESAAVDRALPSKPRAKREVKRKAGDSAES